MGAIGDCCCGCFSSACSGMFRKMRLEIEGTNADVIYHQFIDKTQKVRSRAFEDIVTITISGTPVVGDRIRAGTVDILTVTAANISDIPTALSWELNEGAYYSNYGFISLGYRFCPISYPFVVSGSTLTARGDESHIIPGFGTFLSGYPCQPAAFNVVNSSGSTLAATLSFVTDTPAPYFNENVQALFVGYNLFGGATYNFDYGSVSVPYTRPSPATTAALLAARDAYIADIIDEINTNNLVDCGITVTQQNNWIKFTTPSHVDTVLPHQPGANRIGNPDSSATISELNFQSSGFGVTGAGACCHATLISKPFKRAISDPFGAFFPSIETFDITDKFSHEEWLHHYERTETFTGGTIYTSILVPCPQPGQTFGDPCTFVTPQVRSLFYSHRVRRYIDLAQITMCYVDVSGVPSLQVRLRIEARWRVSRKIMSSLNAGYNTTPLASLAYDAVASESGTGITHNLFSDVFDKTITIPADCPVPEFVFTPVSSDHVTTILSMGASVAHPECCQYSFVFPENLYQPLINAPVKLQFVQCEPP